MSALCETGEAAEPVCEFACLDGFVDANGQADHGCECLYAGEEDLVDEAGADENCDGVDGVDADGDGYASAASGGTDCDDADAGVHPGAPDAMEGACEVSSQRCTSWST